MSPKTILCTGALLVYCLGADIQAQSTNNLELGRDVFEQCAACHSLKPDEHGVGPSLYGIVGRKAGTQAGFRYSSAIKRSGIVWAPETLDAFLRDPQKQVPGNRMPFSGIEGKRERTDLMRYLKKNGPSR